MSWSLLKFIYTELVMLSNHILCCRLLLLSSIFHNIRVFSNELALLIRQPKYWSFSLSTSPSNEYSGLISFRIDWFANWLVWSLCCPRDSQESSPAPQFKSINSSALFNPPHFPFIFPHESSKLPNPWELSPTISKEQVLPTIVRQVQHKCSGFKKCKWPVGHRGQGLNNAPCSQFLQ